MARDLQISASYMVRRLHTTMDKIAHLLAEGGFDLPTYHIQVGRYRQARATIQGLEEMMRKDVDRPIAPSDDREFADLDDDDDDPDVPEKKKPARRNIGGQPHSWGGA